MKRNIKVYAEVDEMTYRKLETAYANEVPLVFKPRAGKEIPKRVFYGNLLKKAVGDK